MLFSNELIYTNHLKLAMVLVMAFVLRHVLTVVKMVVRAVKVVVKTVVLVDAKVHVRPRVAVDVVKVARAHVIVFVSQTV